jgi:hypothetical protein
LTAHNQDVTLAAAAWERVVPKANRPEDTSYRFEEDTKLTLRSWFGDPHLKAGETRTSELISIPPLSGPNPELIFKINAADSVGHQLAAWAKLTSTRQSHDDKIP